MSVAHEDFDSVVDDVKETIRDMKENGGVIGRFKAHNVIARSEYNDKTVSSAMERLRKEGFVKRHGMWGGKYLYSYEGEEIKDNGER